ncbi:MAG: hypothetical protein WC812_02060 [Candidatus Pacearchaeota archaeon]|jgi:hypothetical protein
MTKIKPKIHLDISENLVIKTNSEREAIELMRVFECADWRRDNEKLPTEKSVWQYSIFSNCFEAGINIYGKIKKFGYASENYYKYRKYKIIDFEDFLKKEITSQEIKKINSYFESL